MVRSLPAGIDWITGGSSGIGRAMALRLAREGRQVVISARDETALRAVAEAAKGAPGSVRTLPLDVTDAAACRQAVGRVETEFGPLALAVLCAGTHRPTPANALDPEDFRFLAEVNLLGTANCLVPAVAAMRERHAGRIAVVASLTAKRGLPTAAAYGMTKAGLVNLCEALQPELAAQGIALQVVNPGFVETPLTDRNDFPMPFLVPAEKAAEAIWRGLHSKRFEIAFPWQMALATGLLRRLPNRLALAVTRRMTR